VNAAAVASFCVATSLPSHAARSAPGWTTIRYTSMPAELGRSHSHYDCGKFIRRAMSSESPGSVGIDVGALWSVEVVHRKPADTNERVPSAPTTRPCSSEGSLMVVNSADLAPGAVLRDRADMVAVDEVDAAGFDEVGADTGEVGAEDLVLAGEGLTVRVYRGQERLEDSSACGDLESATLQRAVCEDSNCDPRTAHDLHVRISQVHAPTRQARLGLCASMVMEKELRAGLRVSQ
jgi:hypothetical protein